MYTFILMNDFFKFISATLPNESFVNIKTKVIFNKNTTKKKSQDRYLRNNGIAIENNEVATTQEKMIFLKPLILID